MTKNDKYHSDLPYPEIRVVGPNKEYALLLMDDYAGIVSEMTAINQYLYHSFDNKNHYKEIAKELEEIAVVEMHHMDILAKLIILLGEKPIYFSKNTFWNGSFVDYGNNLLNQLKSDLESEIKAIKKYDMDIRIIADPYIKRILGRIVLDEQIHVQIFTDMINSITKA